MTESRGEAYFDIVWRQLCKSRGAILMLWIIAGLFALAIVAPLLASNQPLWYSESGGLRFPWLVWLLNPETAIDYVFNVALLILPLWAAASGILNRRLRSRETPGRVRVAVLSGLFLAFLGVAAGGLLLVRPANKYFDRDFKRDQFVGHGQGAYTLLPYGPLEQDLDIIFKPPLFRKAGDFSRYRDQVRHWMGTDDSGRDVLARILYGTRISMTIGLVAVSIYMSIGVVIGAIAGYFGGKVDILISRLIEIVLLFPTFFLILTLVGLVGQSIYIIMVVIGLTSWPTIARLTRGEFFKQRVVDYVAAARALGAENRRVMFRHILPNALSPAFVAVPFGIVGAIITEATLSVLGFGVRPPTPSWGSILLIAVSNYEKWWLTLFPALAIFFTVTVFNVVGNALRDAMDPRLKGTQ